MPSPSSEASEPLKNLTILVACSAKKMFELAGGLRALGGTILPFPAIDVQAIEDTHLLDRSLASLREYAWILFTSAYGVRFFMKRLNELAIDRDRRSLPKLCAIGPATAAELKEFGCEAALIPEQFQAEGVLDALANYHGGILKLAGKRLLLPRAQEGREVLPETLSAAGAQVDVVPCYKTVRGQIEGDILRRLREKKPDVMVFTSSSAIRNMIEILGRREGERLLLESTVAVIGPVTGQTAESFGKKAEIVPQENTVPALLEAIRDYYSKKRQQAAEEQTHQ
jgi:uroporphyrinogen III methyltransferase / synthase